MLVLAALADSSPGAASPHALNEQLLLRTAQGDREAFRELYEGSRTAVYAFALSILRDSHAAEDAAQDTFLKVLSAAHLYRPQGKPMAWIMTITRNVCLMQLRSRKQEAVFSDHTPVSDTGVDPIADVTDRLVLETAMEVLSDDESRVIMLHAVSGMKHREIAELLSLPLSTVLSRYNRGIAKLRRKLEAQNEQV